MFLENARLALTSLKANKLRTILTMLGIIIGIAAVIAIVTIGNSMTRSMKEMMSSYGVNNIDVYMSYNYEDEDYSEPAETLYFKQEWLEKMIQTYSDQIKTVSVYNMIGTGSVEHNGKTVKADITGASAGYLIEKNVEIIAGSTFSKRAYLNGDKDCIVSDQFVDNALNGNYQQAIGKTFELHINGTDEMQLRIVGVYHFDYDSWVMSYGDKTVKRDDVSTDMYVPYRVANDYYNVSPELTYFTVVAQDDADTNDLAENIKDFFNDLIPKESKYYCDTYSMQSMIDESEKSMNEMTLAISLIAAIALLVGGIGVMNIMMVSITERTKEIGTRKALGAPNSAIRIQFITEAMVLCLIGGAIGVIVGIIAGIVGSKIMGYPAEIAIWSIFFALGFSLLIGVFFGYYPANKAAKMNPIEALSYE